MNSSGSKVQREQKTYRALSLSGGRQGDNYTVSFITLSAVQSINQIFTKMTKRRVKPINLFQYESSVDEEQNALFTLQLGELSVSTGKQRQVPALTQSCEHTVVFSLEIFQIM